MRSTQLFQQESPCLCMALILFRKSMLGSIMSCESPPCMQITCRQQATYSQDFTIRCFLRLITCLVGNEGTGWHVIKNITLRERPGTWRRSKSCNISKESNVQPGLYRAGDFLNDNPRVIWRNQTWCRPPDPSHRKFSMF